MHSCVIERAQFVSYKFKSLIKLAPGYIQIEWVTPYLYLALRFYSSLRAYTGINLDPTDPTWVEKYKYFLSIQTQTAVVVTIFLFSDYFRFYRTQN